MTSGAEIQLVHEVAREFALGRVLQPVIPDYDVILIDCQPSLGLLTVNALACADSVLVPVHCEYFVLRGVALLVETIDKVSSRLRTSSHCRRLGWPLRTQPHRRTRPVQLTAWIPSWLRAAPTAALIQPNPAR